MIPYAAEKKDINLTKINIIREKAVAPTIKIISPNRFKEKGPAKLITIKINQTALNIGLKVSPALFTSILREWERSYSRLAPANSPEDTTPWASIIHQTPANPRILNLSKLMIIKDMWTTEE